MHAGRSYLEGPSRASPPVFLRYAPVFSTIAMFTRTLSPVVILLMALMLAACGSDSTSPDDPAQPETQNDMPTVEIDVHDDGYAPAHIQLTANETTRLIFTRKGESPCIEKVTIPDLGVDPVDLPMNQPVAIEVTPESDGEFAFTCGMDMVGGTLMVQS